MHTSVNRSKTSKIHLLVVRELEDIHADTRKKQIILETQDLSPQDVERINMGRIELQRLIEAEEDTSQNIEQQIWEEELKIAKTLEKVG